MAKNAYSYNCLQTPVITDFSPKVRTILGKKFFNKISHLIYMYVYTISKKAFEAVSLQLCFLKQNLSQVFFFNHKLVCLLYHFEHVQ